jgi:hypothetical protein
MRKVALFLGAGWSKSWGLPLASEMVDFDHLNPDEFPAKWQRSQIAQLKTLWEELAPQHRGIVDEFGRLLRGTDAFSTFTSYVALRLSSEHWHVGTARETKWATGDHIRMKRRIPSQYHSFIGILKKVDFQGIITTNYDIVVEKILGPFASGRAGGFNYGRVGEELVGRHSVSSRWSYGPVTITGRNPLLKLNGSLNWAFSPDGGLVKYVDCRPSRGRRYNVAMFPPASGEVIDQLQGTWEHAERILEQSNTWIVCGYSFPEYDKNVVNLLRRTSGSVADIVICDPNAENLRGRLRSMLGKTEKNMRIKAAAPIDSKFGREQAAEISRYIRESKM